MMKTDIQLSKPVAIVTGASSGIGCACAEELARAGHRVFGTSRRPRRKAKNAPFQMLSLDVREDGSVADCIDSVLAQAGPDRRVG
jgi:NADP-dependent 3-hydroxy acid dehydrogenase YdfG